MSSSEPTRLRRARARRRPSLELSAALLLSSAACIVDGDRPCDDHQVELEGAIRGCVCDADSVPTADKKHCVPCGDNEVPTGDVCACEPGYDRPTPVSECVPIEDGGLPDAGAAASGEGEPCSSQADCAGFEADYCQTIVSPNICLVQGCAFGEAQCGSGAVCCLFDIPPLDDTHGLCIPRASCIAPGEVVEP